MHDLIGIKRNGGSGGEEFIMTVVSIQHSSHENLDHPPPPTIHSIVPEMYEKICDVQLQGGVNQARLPFQTGYTSTPRTFDVLDIWNGVGLFIKMSHILLLLLFIMIVRVS